MTLGNTQDFAPPVQAVVLFGSQARGDHDQGSDVDIAVFAEADSLERLAEIKHWLSEAAPISGASISFYSVLTAERMALDGSLFLWHLRYEGKILFERNNWFTQLLGELAPYGPYKAIQDVATFETVLGDIRESLQKQSATLVFEAATLFSVFRNLGMIVTAFGGRPCFGRLEPINHLRRLMGAAFPLSPAEIELLLAAKLAYTRGVSSQPVGFDEEWCLSATEGAYKALAFAREVVHA